MAKDKVEDALKLSIFRLKKFGAFKVQSVSEGSLTWSLGDEEIGSIRYVYYPDDTSLRLIYKWKYNWDTEYTQCDYMVQLVKSPCNLGGYRLWFRCPRCYRRSACLYKLNQQMFTCRKCHNLTYQSQCENKTYRYMKPYFEPETLYKRLYSLRTHTYRGKPTRKAQYLQNKIEYLEEYSPYYFEEMMSRLVKRN
jgi:hypothetical protein